MKEKPFWRPTNIWRVIGGGVAFIGLVCMVIFPTQTYPDAIIYRKFNDKGQLSFLLSVWHGVILFGFLGFFPTLKEWTVSMFGKKKKPEEQG